MDSPYFTSHWTHPSRRYFHAPPSQIPVHRANSSPAQKVVEIPVQYVSTNKPNRLDSAVKIQRVFRGYLVRKSVKKIAEITRDVVVIERRVSEKESVEMIRNDANERLRLNESLMNLLFKLDSVSGVDFCVRELRKRVIKKVIRLQEIVDEIALSEQDKADVAGGELNEDVEAVGAVTEGAKSETESNAEVAIDEAACSEEAAVSISEGFDESIGQTESQADSSPIIEEEEKDEGEEREEEGLQKSEEVAAENKRSRELLERMVEDNEKMMGLMAELFERNEMQTRLLSALSQRVGQLERAFMCERLRKKKKKNGNGGSVGCFDSTKDHCSKKSDGKKE